jgi:uncharacterized protein
MTDNDKVKKLHQLFRELEQVVVTFSGGIDSTLLAKVAAMELGDGALALTAISPSLATLERNACHEIAQAIGIRHLEVTTEEMTDPRYTANPENRCYYCKDELFSVATRVATQHGISHVVEGTNVDDLSGHRPGLEAVRQWGIRSPYLEAGFGKQEIRSLARELGLSIWDKPSLACLSSRFPTGVELTVERLKQIDQAESAICKLGIRQFRGRYHGTILRVELSPDELPRIQEQEIQTGLTECACQSGFDQVVLDLLPYGAERGSVSLVVNLSPERVQILLERLNLASIEIQIIKDFLILQMGQESIEKLFQGKLRETLIQRCRELGFRHITLGWHTNS